MMKRHQYAIDLTLPFVCASLSTDLQKKKAKKAKKRALDAKELADAVTERQRAEQMPEGPDQGVALKAAQDREERAREAVAVHGKSSKKIKASWARSLWRAAEGYLVPRWRSLRPPRRLPAYPRCLAPTHQY